MKSKKMMLGKCKTIILLLVMLFIFFACDNGSTGNTVAEDLQATLSSGQYQATVTDSNHTGLTVVMGSDTITISGGDLGSPVTISGIYTAGGGTITGIGYTSSKWTYVYRDDEKIGYIFKYNFAGTDVYYLYIGKFAKLTQAGAESQFGITLDTTGIVDYPSIHASKVVTP